MSVAWLAGALVVFAAHLVFGVAGFGTGLVAMAFLPFLMTTSDAVVLMTILTIVFAVVMFVPLRRDVTPRELVGLMLGSIVGTPAGVWILAVAPAELVNRLIGAMLIVVVAARVRGAVSATAARPRGGAWARGFSPDCSAGAVGLPGPPIIVYGATRDWSPRTFKANLQAFFIVNQSVILLGYGLAGLLTAEVARLTGIYLLPALAGTLVGMSLFNRVDPVRFRRLVFALLLVSGVVLLVRG